MFLTLLWGLQEVRKAHTYRRPS